VLAHRQGVDARVSFLANDWQRPADGEGDERQNQRRASHSVLVEKISSYHEALHAGERPMKPVASAFAPLHM
jgi:hypothetical protein